MALFSEKADAIPVALFHGWPGSFIEFIGVLQEMKQRYSPANLPYHLVVPSLTGYTFSSGPPVNRNWDREDTSRIMNKLMLQIGFQNGYIAQGGDIGSSIARILAAKYDECKGSLVSWLF
jgi:microsomal epoxide hydrolase